jgi:glycerol-3-phosphate dehydrogenase (NAD(P)+)
MGLSQSLQGTGAGLQAVVLSRGLAEVGRLARALGSDEATLWGLAGVGDLVAVHGKPGSTFFDAGVALAKRQRADGPWGTAEALAALARKHQIETPLIDGLLETVAGGDPVDLVQKLMSRRSAKERR